MKNLMVTTLVAAFSTISFSNSEAGKFDSFEKTVNMIKMSCWDTQTFIVPTPMNYATDGKDLYKGRDYKYPPTQKVRVGQNDVVSIDKKRGENTFVFTVDYTIGGLHIVYDEYINFQKKVKITKNKNSGEEEHIECR